jgi:primosomal protein N'
LVLIEINECLYILDEYEKKDYKYPMNLITVIPLTRQKVAPTLSYFTSSTVPVGAIVTVPLRSKTISAIVSDSRPVSDVKADVKSAPFEIRKLGAVKATAFFPSSFIDACRHLALHYATTTGAIVDAVIPDIIMENVHKIAAPNAFSLRSPSSSDASRIPNEVYAIQGDDVDRVSTWRSMIRQEFARKKSIVFHTPTIEDAKTLFALLEKGIEGYIFILHNKLAKKEIIDTWQLIAKTDHAVTIITAGIFPLLPRTDISSVIIERENGRGWISPKSPYIDLRKAFELINRNQPNRSIYLADSLLRTETLHRLDNNEISQGSPFKWRSISTATDALINMVPERAPRSAPREESPEPEAENGNAKNGFKVLSPELERLIIENRDESSHLFIYAVRRGLATMTICRDCETIVSCASCGSPVVLHASKDSGRNFFMCHVCGTRRSADEVCKNCGGWRLEALGIGLDRVEQEIKAKFPGVDVFKIDAEITKTDKQISATLEKFRSKPGSILLGTELASLHLHEPVDHCAVVSLDSLFALPDFRIPEKIMYALIRLRTLARKTILVQTRRIEEKVFEYALKGNLSDFHRETISERRRFGYPPFMTLVKVSIEGKKESIAEQMAQIQKEIEPHEIDIFPAFTGAARGNSIIHGLIKIAPESWPHIDLIEKLRALPPNVSVKVDPESLL